MISEKMDLIYAVLKDEGFELSSASYEKDEYHIFYKDGVVLTIDLSTDDIRATMMYFDINHEFVSYTYELTDPSCFDNLLEHVLNLISTSSTSLKWNLTLYELIHLDKLIFVSMRDLKNCTTNDNLSTIKIDRIMNFDRKLFDMLLGPSHKNNKITLLYNKLVKDNFKIMLIEKTNTGMCNITRALFIKQGILLTLFYEESGVVLCGDIYLQTKKRVQDDLYFGDDNIVDCKNESFILYKLKLSKSMYNHISEILKTTDLIYPSIGNEAYKNINLSSSISYLANKCHKRLDSIKNELSIEDLKNLGIK